MLPQFLEKLRSSLSSRTFVKLTLSQPRQSTEAGLRNLYGRVVELRNEGRQLSLLWRYATRDVTKNLPFEEACRRVEAALELDFERGSLFTISGDWQFWARPDGRAILKASRPAFAVAPAELHDHQKHRPIPIAGNGFLQALGVTNPAGEPRPGKADKLRQIQRFAEILGHLLDASSLNGRESPLRVADMGAGKGYLTFATAELLRQRALAAEVTGVEMREDLVALANGVAQRCGFDRLRFVRGAIGDYAPEDPADILIALHACDTATDDALFQGIQAKALLIIVAPCCHKEVRPQITPPPALREVLRHGILLEREAEILTDGLRALLLQIHGYQAQVFEFISNEHTGKNLMITAQKTAEPAHPERLREQLQVLLREYGIREQRLARLLGEL